LEMCASTVQTKIAGMGIQSLQHARIHSINIGLKEIGK
jgi:hypothetical protein